MNKRELYNLAIKKYGVNAQIDMCIEEMSELTKALLKHRRAIGDFQREKKIYADIKEEMADVSIMLEQMEGIFGDFTLDKEKKLSRLEKRLSK